MEKPREFWIKLDALNNCLKAIAKRHGWDVKEEDFFNDDEIKHVRLFREVMTEEQSELNRLKAENARLREALEFYANERCCTMHDREIAREALKGGE